MSLPWGSPPSWSSGMASVLPRGRHGRRMTSGQAGRFSSSISRVFHSPDPLEKLSPVFGVSSRCADVDDGRKQQHRNAYVQEDEEPCYPCECHSLIIQFRFV